MIRQFFPIFLALLTLKTAPVSAWSELGHRVSAGVAVAYLTPQSQREIQRLIGAGEDLPSISTWADEIRGSQPETRSWHYITLQVRTKGEVADPVKAEKPNVLTALDAQMKRLADRGGDQGRTEALRWIVHLVADLHQPLHAGEDRDRGGNETQVLLQRRKMGWHQVWDHGYLNKLGLGEHALISRLLDTAEARQRSHAGYVASVAAAPPLAMVRESHGLARQAYARRGRPIHGRGRGISLEAEDVAWGQAVALEQLLKSGLRLAGMLNQTLDPQGPLLAAKPRRPDKPSADKVKAGSEAASGSAFVWSASSQVYHVQDCADAARINPTRLRRGNSPPGGRRLHKNCPSRK